MDEDGTSHPGFCDYRRLAGSVLRPLLTQQMLAYS